MDVLYSHYLVTGMVNSSQPSKLIWIVTCALLTQDLLGEVGPAERRHARHGTLINISIINTDTINHINALLFITTNTLL